LQAFLPEREAEAVEGDARRPERDRPAGGAGAAGSDRVRWAQAIVISMLRDDPRVVGAHAALCDVEIVIGEARRSLDAVHRYKEAQASGIVALWSWPIGLVVGLVIASLLSSVSTTAILVVIAAAVAGWVLALAPAYGWAVGSMASRIERMAMRAHDARIVALGRAIASGVGLGLLFVGPVLIGSIITVVCDRSGSS
jgi:hypothetical protein